MEYPWGKAAKPDNDLPEVAIAKAWQREWSLIREEFLAGRLPEIIVAPVTASQCDGVRWECPICGGYGQGTASHDLAQSRGRRRTQMHASPDDLSRLEEIKVLRMSEGLLTAYQREKRTELRQQGVKDDF